MFSWVEINTIRSNNNSICVKIETLLQYLFKKHPKVSLRKNFYRSTEVFSSIGRHSFLQILKLQPAFFHNFFWFNKYFRKEDNPVYLTKFAANNIIFLSQLFEEGNLKPWKELNGKYNSKNKTYFQWLQLNLAIPHKWKTKIKQSPGNISNLLIQHHLLIKEARIWTLEKMTSKEL